MIDTEIEDMMDPDRAVKRYLVTESTFGGKEDPSELMSWIRAHGSTGQVTFNLGQGGTASVVLVERMKLPHGGIIVRIDDEGNISMMGEEEILKVFDAKR